MSQVKEISEVKKVESLALSRSTTSKSHCYHPYTENFSNYSFPRIDKKARVWVKSKAGEHPN